ncbi:MAG: peptidylprolyl isomerase [Deltaproteobacteria bacterium]|nr:peptidylprolyl isomerase [Deltaproteobacteria bacterium]
MKFIITASTFVSMLVMLIGAMTPPNAWAVDIGAEAEIIMRINGSAVTRDELNAAYNALLPRVSMHTSVSDKRKKSIQKTALNQIIEAALIYQNAKEAKENKAPAKEIDAVVADLKKTLPQGQTLKDVLKRSKMTMDDLKELIRKDIVIKRFNEQKNADFKNRAAAAVSGQYLLDYYNANLEKFSEPEQLRVMVILVKADPSGGQTVWKQALKKAEEAHKELKAGADFIKVSKEYSEHPNAQNGGDVGWKHRDSFDEINDAVNALKPGDISKPVQTMYGYAIAKLEGVKPSAQKKFEELNKERLRRELQEKEERNMRSSWLASLRAKAKIEYLAKDALELSKETIKP